MEREDYVRAAREQYPSDRIEIDDERDPRVDELTGGAWVPAWVYVDRPAYGGPSIDELTDQYDQWLDANNLPKESAEDLLVSATLTAEQRQWLEAFCETWETAQRHEDDRDEMSDGWPAADAPADDAPRSGT